MDNDDVSRHTDEDIVNDKEFKCPQCHKIYPTTQCSNQIWKGKWVCKMCNKLFEGNVLGYIDEDEERAVLTAEEILCEENRFD